MTAPDPNAPGTMVTSTKPERYTEPFYVGAEMVVQCKECSRPDNVVMVLVMDVLDHDDYHSTEEALEAGG